MLINVQMTACFSCLFFLNRFKNHSKNEAGQYCVHQSEERKRSVSPRPMAAAQVDANRHREEAGGQMGSGAAGPEQTDGGAKPEEAEAPESRAKLKLHPSREQMEGSFMCGGPSRGR